MKASFGFFLFCLRECLMSTIESVTCPSVCSKCILHRVISLEYLFKEMIRYIFCCQASEYVNCFSGNVFLMLMLQCGCSREERKFQIKYRIFVFLLLLLLQT